MSKTTIKKMVIELNGKDVELTMTQARELHAALNELFEEKVREIRLPDSHPIYPRPWRWPYPRPFWVASSGTKFQISNRETMRCQLKSG